MKRWWIIGLLVVAGLAVGLYRAKLGAQENEERIAALKAEIGKTAGEVSVLKADEAYLSRPERIGPLARDIEQRRYGSAEASIERADNRATVVFAIGVMLASSLLLLGTGALGFVSFAKRKFLA